jgi:hypothetical protein
MVFGIYVAFATAFLTHIGFTVVASSVIYVAFATAFLTYIGFTVVASSVIYVAFAITSAAAS